MKNRLCLGLIFAMSLSGLLWGEPSTVPFSDDFEDYAVGTPLVNGLNGWYGSEPEVKVQDQIAYSGQAAQVPLDCSLSNRFTGAAHSSLWMRIHTRPVLHDNQPEIETNAAISFYINQEGYFVIHDGPPTNWVELTHNITGEPMTPLTGAEWVQIDIYQDFTTKTWDLYVNYNLITNQIGFINPSIASLHGLGFYNGITATSYIDNVWVIATKPPDLATNANNWLPHIVVDATNIECSVLEGIVDHSTTYAVWETNGYYPLGFTNSISGLSGAQDWLQLSPATGTSTGQPTTVTLTFSTEGLEPGVYTGLVTVAGQDTRFGFPAGNSPSYIPVTMRVETNLPVLCCEPLVLDQTIVKGSNPTNQIFEIWNDSAAPVIPMAFEMTCAYSGPTNFSLSFTNGVSSGERFTSAVVFSDMSEYDSGSYTGRITISAWDAWPGYKPPLAQVLTTNLLVTVKIVGMEPPAGIWASEGTYTDQVAIHWDPAEGAASYELWRGTTFDLDYAEKISEVGSTNYADTTAVPGNLYYYWVRPVNPRGVIGSMSAYATGYRALAAPDSVLATKAVYTNRVIVQWSLAEGASSYHVYRSLLGKPETQQIVYRAGGLEYTDSQAQDGECYYYQVQSTKGPFNSALSTGDFGCVLSSPQQLKATKGTLAAQVRLSWKAVEGATSYEIWRHSSAQPQAATLLGLATQAAYNDKAVTPSVTYYYWIKAKNATALSGFSRMDHGYTAMGDVALTLRQLVLKPTILPVSSSPALASFRLRNNGPMDLAAPHTALEISFLMGLTPEISAAQLVGTVKQNVTLAAGTETVVRLNQPHKIRMPTAPGTYYLFCRAAPVAPNRLLDGSQGHNETIGVGRIHVQGTGQARYWSVNDYSGDGLSDLTAYTPAQGTWDVRTVAGQVLGQNVLFGAPGFIPVPGDYDGDHLADP
ncbi:MAG: hypothetical protein GX806_04785, partial [Lentisphaerae bacterium]|nr:hypothetical protein [Lentisphaerota bacterium]